MEKLKKVILNNQFKISIPTWNEKLELSDGSYSVSHLQDSFEYFIEKHETVTDSSPIRIYVNKTENIITFRIKIGYHLEHLTSFWHH